MWYMMLWLWQLMLVLQLCNVVHDVITAADVSITAL